MGLSKVERIEKKKAFIAEAIEKVLLEYTQEKITELIDHSIRDAIISKGKELAGLSQEWSRVELRRDSPYYEIVQREAERSIKEAFVDFKLELTEKEKKDLRKEYHNTYLEQLEYAVRDAANEDALSTFESYADMREEETDGK